MEPDDTADPFGLKNYTEEELSLAAKREHGKTDICSAKYFFRLNKLSFKKIGFGKTLKLEHFKSQDLVVNINRNKNYILGQPDQCDEDFTLDAKHGVEAKFESEHGAEDETDNEVDEEEMKTKGNLYLFGDCSNPLIKTRHCQLSRESETDQVLIKDLGSKLGTFVNGVRLIPEESRILKTDDIFSLGISHLDPECKLDYGKFWVFKYMEESPEEEEQLKDLSCLVFENAAILSCILDGLDFSSLKRARLTSKFWNESAKPLVKKDGKITLNLNRFSVEENLREWEEYFSNRASIFELFQLNSLTLGNFCCAPIPEDITVHGVEIFQNFFQNYGHQIMNLDLYMEWDSVQPESRFFTDIVLQSLFNICKNIKKVIIDSDLSDAFVNMPLSESTTILEVNQPQNSIKNLLVLFPRIAELTLGDDVSAKSLLEFATDNEQQESATQLLRHLKVLTIHNNYEETVEEFLNDSSEVDICNLLKEFPVRVPELELRDFIIKSTFVSDFYNSISGFRHSLVKLTFGMAMKDETRDQDLNVEVMLRFPKMELLKTLIIQGEEPHFKNLKFQWEDPACCFPNLQNVDVVVRYTDEISSELGKTIEKKFLRAEYLKHFPKLLRLSVKSKHTFCLPNDKYIKYIGQ